MQVRRWHPTVPSWLDPLVGAGVLAVNLATLGGFFATGLWLFDLPTQFTVQFVILQGLALVYFIARRRARWPILLTLPFIAANLIPISRYYVPAAPAAAVATPNLRVLTLNLWARNDRANLVEGLIQTEAPDIVFLAEATPQWHHLLQQLRPSYPYSAPTVDDRTLPIMLLSRWPVKDAKVVRLGSRGRPTIIATVCKDVSGDKGACGLVVGLHTDRPLGPALARSRNTQLDELASLIAQQPERRVIVMGDFNLTPWSPYFHRFLDDARLRDSATGRGVAPTWFSRLLPFGLPIDQILLGPDVEVIQRRVGADVGSDHFPVIADLAF